jgi:hypothetical protein
LARSDRKIENKDATMGFAMTKYGRKSHPHQFFFVYTSTLSILSDASSYEHHVAGGKRSSKILVARGVGVLWWWSGGEFLEVPFNQLENSCISER